MLYKVWDTRRSVRPSSTIDKLFRPITAFIAFKIMGDQNLQFGISQRNLERLVIEYLLCRRLDDHDEALELAKEFIEHFVHRSAVMVPVGTSGFGDQVFDFAHRTFMEYFAAIYLVRTFRTAEDLAAFVLPKILEGKWYIVAQLAFHILADEREGAGDELLKSLSDHAGRESGKKAWRLYDFQAECLKFIVPNPKTLQIILEACFQCCVLYWLHDVREFRKDPLDLYYNQEREPTSLCYALLGACSENQRGLAKAVENWIVEKIESKDEELAEIAFDLAFNVTADLDERDHRRFDPGGDKHHWIGIAHRVFSRCSDSLIGLCPTDARICAYLWNIREISLTALIQWHTIGVLFRGWHGITYSNLALVSIFDSLYDSLLQHHGPIAEANYPLDGIAEVGQVLSKMRPPWVKEQEEAAYGLYSFLPRYEEGGKALSEDAWHLLKTKADAVFGLVGMFATIVEMQESNSEIVSYIKERAYILVRPVAPILLARLESEPPDPSNGFLQVMDHLPLRSDQKAFLEKWALKKIDLVAPR